LKVLGPNQINLDKWESLLLKSSYSSPFQTPDFYRFCKQSKYLSCDVFAIENNEGNYVAVCLATIQKEKGLKSYFSRRAIIYGGPIIAENFSQEAFGLLLNVIESKLKKKVIYIEVRNYHNYSAFRNEYDKKEWLYQPYLNIKVSFAFSNALEILSSFKYNRRREVKLSIKSGLAYGSTDSPDDIGEVYNILHKLYTQEVGLPLPPLKYFEDLRETGLLKAFVVKDNEKTVGGSFCLVLNNQAIYTYYYCGLRDYKPKTYPTHLAVLAAMEYGVNNNLKYLDFMGAGLANKDYGVRKYKKEFGGNVVEEGRFLKITNKPLYKLGVLAMKILKKKD